jgi:YidC/Oxa1 family membrane protein insertase
MIGFDDLYFANVSVFEGAKNKAIYDRNLQALLIPASGRLSFKVFWGPKELHLLESYGQDFKKLIDLGFFAILAEPILRFLLWLGDLLKNYGLAIVLMTIIIRLLLYPLNSISYKAMQKLKEIQPELEELKAKYKDDPQALNRELILFYQKKGVNPLKGCLPILLQLPIFFGLFSALHHAIELRYSTFFGWIKDLSSPDYIYIFSFPVPLLTLILGATLIWQHKITPIQVSDPDQERVLKLMPYIFIVMLIIVPLPAGNLVYWLVSNILSIGQQLVMQRSGLKISPFWINLALGCVIFLMSGLLVWLF